MSPSNMWRRISITAVVAFACITTVAAVAPGPPESLTAAVTGNTVALAWTAPSSGGPPSSYLVDVAFAPNAAAVATFPVSGTSVVATAVPSGVYFVRVRAINVDGVSGPSNEVAVSVPIACPTPPNAPAIVNFSVFGRFATVNWMPAAGGCPAGSYSIQVGSAPGLVDLAIINAGALTTLTAAAPFGTYYVRVVAQNGAGASPPSNEVTINVANVAPNVAGRWTGTSPTYPNAPFTFDLRQSGNNIDGDYRDQYDTGAVFGTVTVDGAVLNVNFFDGGIRFTGTFVAPNRLRGLITGIGGTHTFELTR